MESASKHWSHAAIEVVHDLAAGTWPGAASALWLVRRRAEQDLPADELASAMAPWTSALLVMVAALAVLVLTGILRAAYAKLGFTRPAMKARTGLVLIKHAVFVLVFIAATVVAIGSLQP